MKLNKKYKKIILLVALVLLLFTAISMIYSSNTCDIATDYGYCSCFGDVFTDKLGNILGSYDYENQVSLTKEATIERLKDCSKSFVCEVR